MSDQSLGRAVLELVTDDAAYEKGLGAAEAKARGWAGNVSGVAKGAALAIAGVGAAAGAIVGSLVASATAVAHEASEVARLKREMGLTAEESSKLKYAAGRLNVDTDSLSKSFGILSKSLESTHPSLAKYNIEVIRATDGHILMEPTLGKIADRFKSLPDGAEKTALALDIFGRSGKDLIPLLNQGADGLKTMGDEAAKLGLVFDDKTLASAKRLTQAHKDLDDRLEGLRNRIGIAFLPVLADWVGGLVNAADKVLPAVSAALETVTGWMGKGLEAIKGPGQAAIDLVSGAVKAFADLWNGGDVEIGNFADTFKRIFGIQIPEWALQAAGSVVGEMRKIPGVLAQVVGSIGEIFDVATGRRPEAGGVLRSLVGDVKAAGIMGSVAAVRDAMKDAFEIVKPIVQGVIDKVMELKDRFDDLPPAIRAFAAAAVVGQATGFNDWLLGAAANVAQVGGGVAAAARAFPGFIEGIVGAVKLLPTWIGLQGIAAAEMWATLAPILLCVAAGIALGVVIGLLIIFWDQWTAALGNLAGAIVAFVGGALSAFGTAVHDFIAFWGRAWTEISSKPGYYLGLALGSIIGLLLNIAQAIGDFVGGAITTITGWLGDTVALVRDHWLEFAIAIFNALVGTLASIIQFGIDAGSAILRWLGDTKTNIWDFFGGLPEAFRGFAIDAIHGLVNGFLGMGEWVRDQIFGFFAGIIDGIKNALGIHSPSTIFAGIGASMMTGLAQGISANAVLPQLQLGAAITGTIAPAAAATAGGGAPAGAGSRPIIIQVPVAIDGRGVAYATATYDNVQSRRYGLGVA